LKYAIHDTTTATHLFHQVLWGDLEGYAELLAFWHYFKPLSYRVRIYGVDKNTTNAVPTVSAFYPVNFVTDSGVASAFYTDASVASIRGAVMYQDGSRNVGPMQRWPASQIAFGTIDASTSEAGVMISNHTYPTTYPASYRFELTVICRFFRRSLLPGAPVEGLKDL
jgi:hypothetical protein